MKQNFTPVVVAHGTNEISLYVQLETNTEILLTRLSNNIYMQEELPNIAYRYCIEENGVKSYEDFWRNPTDTIENHVYGKETLDLNAPELPKVLDVQLVDPDIRAPKSEIFDDTQVVSFIVNSEGGVEGESDEYSPCTISFISKYSTYIDLEGKVKWSGESTLNLEPHNYKINFKGDLLGIPLVYAKKCHYDKTGVQEKISRDIANSLGYIDLRSSYTYLTVNGVYHGAYPLVERYTDTNMASFVGHTPNNIEEPSSYLYCQNGKLSNDVPEPDAYELEYQNTNQRDIMSWVSSELAGLLSNPNISYEEFQELYDTESLAKAMATNLIIDGRDSFFYSNHNYYYSLLYGTGQLALLLWDFDIALQHGTDLEYIANSCPPSAIPSEVSWAQRYPEFTNRYHEIMQKAFDIGLFDPEVSNIVERADYFNDFMVANDTYHRTDAQYIDYCYKTAVPETLENIKTYLDNLGLLKKNS